MEQVFCGTEQAIVEALLAGKIASANRGTGKTTGLLIAIHLRHRGDAKIVVHVEQMMRLVARRYREMFPEDAEPDLIRPIRGGVNLEDISGNVYADELGLMTAEVRHRLHASGYLCGATT